MPGMPVTMGWPMPTAVQNMPHGARSGCSGYAGTYSAVSDPMLTYFSAIAGQPHRLRDGSGFCGADMHLLKNVDCRSNVLVDFQVQDGEVAEKLQRYLMQSEIRGTYYFLAVHHGILSDELLEEKRITNLSKFMFGRTAVNGSYCRVFNLPS
ncbi:grancalcin isoform 1-T7 [Ciconia maguari]